MITRASPRGRRPCFHPPASLAVPRLGLRPAYSVPAFQRSSVLVASMPMRSTVGLISLALLRASAQPVSTDDYAVLTTDGATCTSAGLMPIASKSECDTAVAAINAANGWSGYGTTGQVSYGFRPSGCHSSCFTTTTSPPAGYYCVNFNTADTSHGVEGDTRVFVFCSSQPLPALPPPLPPLPSSPPTLPPSPRSPPPPVSPPPSSFSAYTAIPATPATFAAAALSS